MALNPIALKYIYDETLFHFSEEVVISSKNKGYLGENNSNIAIFSNSKFDKSDIALFEKILNALNLSFADIALIENQKEDKIKELKAEISPKKIILFGVNPFEIGYKEITLNTYEITKTDSTDILQAEIFNKYHTDPTKKKALWFALQKLLV